LAGFPSSRPKTLLAEAPSTVVAIPPAPAAVLAARLAYHFRAWPGMASRRPLASPALALADGVGGGTSIRRAAGGGGGSTRGA